MNSDLKHLRQIDGLRAIAVLSVVMFHGGFKFFSMGDLGVDIFFVISGYLFTSILLTQREAGTFSYTYFYIRRARRILPALYFVLGFSIPLAFITLDASNIRLFSLDLLSVLLFVSNYAFINRDDYFSNSSDLNPLIHTWSLSVEEQFYFVYPVALFVICSVTKRIFTQSFIIILLGSLVFASTILVRWPDVAFYSLPTRIWEFLSGGLVFLALQTDPGSRRAIYLNRYHRFLRPAHQMAALTGLALVVISLTLFNANDRAALSPNILIVVGSALIIAFARPYTFVGVLLGQPAIRWIGLCSYSIYLWHQPLFAFARSRSIYGPPDRIDYAALILASIFLGYVTWRLIEMPFRQMRLDAFRRRSALGAVAVLGLFCFAVSGILFDGFRHWTTNQQPFEFDSRHDFPNTTNGWCFYSVDSNFSLPLGEDGTRCNLGNRSSTITALLVGDSFAGQYEPFWNKLGLALNIRINSVTTNWCYPALTDNFPGPPNGRAHTQCRFNRQYAADQIANASFIIVGGNWGYLYTQHALDEVFKYIELAETIKKPVIIMPSAPIYDIDIRSAYRRAINLGRTFEVEKIGRTQDIAYQVADRELQRLSQSHHNIFFISRNALFPWGDSQSRNLEALLSSSFDGRHVTIFASQQAADTFLSSPENLQWFQEITTKQH